MIVPERPGVDLGPSGALLFADCAVVPDPNPEELAEIARATAENARAILDTEPCVAFLSFSTKARRTTRASKKSGRRCAS